MPDVGSITIARCRPLADKYVLALAAQAWPEVERAGHWQAIRGALDAGEASRVVLLAARRGKQLIGAVLGQVMPGRTAVVWMPQVADELANTQAAAKICTALLDQLAIELAASDAAVAQALLAHNDSRPAELLQASGYEHAADLLYLVASAETFPNQPPELPFTLECFNPAEESRLARLIDRTYVGSRDLPQIDGLRTAAEAIAGYRAVGEVRPNLWQFIRTPDGDAGCLLVNLHPDVRHAEVVYLGIVPEVRGRGWGRKLAQEAQWLAHTCNCERVVLAVDAANDPAISAYAATGFSEWDRRSVWVRPLPTS